MGTDLFFLSFHVFFSPALAPLDIEQSPYLAKLHDQIQVCDDILANMETLLGGFQANLGSISSEIQVLQDKSLSLSTKLRNRKVVQAELGNFLDELVIPPELVSKICDSDVDEKYNQYLEALNRKITFLSDKTTQNLPAVNTVAPELERLKNKVLVWLWLLLLFFVFCFLFFIFLFVFFLFLLLFVVCPHLSSFASSSSRPRKRSETLSLRRSRS